ncbi:MAG: hypothetical protein ACLGID_13005 [Gammaproteobacteria bacterium]
MSEITAALAGNNNATYENASPARKRSIAVAAALDLISVRIGATSPNGNNLGAEMDKLSHYADQIQAALNNA